MYSNNKHSTVVSGGDNAKRDVFVRITFFKLCGVCFDSIRLHVLIVCFLLNRADWFGSKLERERETEEDVVKQSIQSGFDHSTVFLARVHYRRG